MIEREREIEIESENKYKCDINDPKYNIKSKLRSYLVNKIHEFEHNKNKVRNGRPNSLSIEECVDAIFLCSN